MSKVKDLIKELCPNGVEFYQIKDIAKVTFSRKGQWGLLKAIPHNIDCGIFLKTELNVFSEMHPQKSDAFGGAFDYLQSCFLFVFQ